MFEKNERYSMQKQFKPETSALVLIDYQVARCN